MPIEYKQGVLVTPSLAKKWLAKNTDENRNPKRSKIPMFVRDMKAGEWDSETGETLKFDEDGWLLDGQNRLYAVIAYGRPVKFDIATGLKRKTMRVLDTGSARTASDALKISGSTSRTRAASIVRWVILWDGGVFTSRGGGTVGRANPTNSEILDRFNAEPGAFDAATRRADDCSHRRLCNGSSAGVAHYLFSRIDTEYTQRYFDQFISGANLPEKSPILALRSRFTRIRIDRITPAEQLALFVRSWNVWRKDKEMGGLIIARGDLTNTNFPQPK